MKKFFKYLFLGLGSVILLAIIGVAIWWHPKTDSEKSNLLVKAHAYDTAMEYDQENSDALMERSVSFNKAGDFNQGFKFRFSKRKHH